MRNTGRVQGTFMRYDENEDDGLAFLLLQRNRSYLIADGKLASSASKRKAIIDAKEGGGGRGSKKTIKLIIDVIKLMITPRIMNGPLILMPMFFLSA